MIGQILFGGGFWPSLPQLAYQCFCDDFTNVSQNAFQHPLTKQKRQRGHINTASEICELCEHWYVPVCGHTYLRVKTTYSQHVTCTLWLQWSIETAITHFYFNVVTRISTANCNKKLFFFDSQLVTAHLILCADVLNSTTAVPKISQSLMLSTFDPLSIKIKNRPLE